MITNEIAGHTLEYYDEDHVYICDGVVVPSITQILKVKFGNKYNRVSGAVLSRAAEKGTAVHSAIEEYCKHGTESELPELRGFKFLMKHYNFTVRNNEVPVILFRDDVPIAAGRLDLVISMNDMKDGNTGLADIKRTATLDKEYLAYQLNLYSIAYQQCYGIHIQFLKGIHLRENVRKFVDIPINEKMPMELVNDYFERYKDE